MLAVQVKIVGDFCNLRCTYCRDRDFNQENKVVMEFSVLQTLVESLALSQQNLLHMHWLGGEPTLAGLDFFKSIIELQRRFTNKRWVNTIQTNGTLIDHDWAEFLKTNSFRVGVSIDGTPETHDTNRVNLSGRGSYRKAMNGVRILQSFDINPSVICVVTKHNMSAGTEMLRNLVDSGFVNIAFNTFYNTATNLQSDPFAVSDEEWSQFLKDIFEEWLILDREDVHVREIDSILAWTQGRSARSCTFRGSCANWVLVDHDGQIYPCERLGRSICFGDISSMASFDEILELQAHEVFKTETSRIPDKCQSCPMQDFCHNGCTAHRTENGGNPTHYVYCGSRLSFYRYLMKRIKVIKT